jgi:hypothetical protein
LLAACGSSSPTHYYALATDNLPAQEQARTGIMIGIGPITLPDYLARTTIVQRNNNELTLSEFNLWAEPLTDATPRVLTSYLRSAMPNHRFIASPWGRYNIPDARMPVRISRFEAVDGQVELIAEWQLFDNNNTEILFRTEQFSAPINGTGFDAIAEAHNDALKQLAQALGRDIAALNDQPQHP